MDGMPLTYDEIQSFISIEQSQLDDLVDKGYLKLEYPKDLINRKRHIRQDLPLGYNIVSGKLSFPISKILDPNQYCPTLTATDSSKLAVYTGLTIRQLNLSELKKLCGFPDTFECLSTKSEMYDLFGNTVCPPVVEKALNILFR